MRTRDGKTHIATYCARSYPKFNAQTNILLHLTWPMDEQAKQDARKHSHSHTYTLAHQIGTFQTHVKQEAKQEEYEAKTKMAHVLSLSLGESISAPLSCLFKIIGAIPNVINLWCLMSKDMRHGLACQIPCKFDEIITACTLLTSSCFHNIGPMAWVSLPIRGQSANGF